MNTVARAFSDWTGGVVGGAESAFAGSGGDRLAASLFSFRGEGEFSGADALATPVDDAFREAASRLGLKPRPFWPEGKPYAFCTTHDIDRVLSSYHGLRGWRRSPLGLPARIFGDLWSLRSRSAWEENPFFNFDRADAIETELGVRSAYYVLFEKRRPAKSLLAGEIQHTVGVYRPEALKEELCRLEDRGHEIGIHASFDAAKGDEDSGRELRDERERLLGLGIRAVTGVRNHYLEYDARASASAQRRAGFDYDSTYGFNTRNGFRAGTAFPYAIDGIWELPFQVMDSALRAETPSPAARREIAERILGRVREVGGVFVLNWHLHTMNPEIFPDEVALFRELVAIAKRDGAWTALPREVIAWWSRRATP